jgi:hypothetical protein
VRRRTQGRQIPWESTSLEEDFYFVLPEAELQRLARERAEQQAAADRERQRQAEERAQRERAKQERQAEEWARRERAEQERQAEERARRERAERERQAEERAQRERAERERQAEERARQERQPQALKPAPVRPPDAAAAARQFEEELALWEKIQEAGTPEPLEDYLLRYPSGRFSELAQFRLDRVLARLGEKRIEIVSAPDNPYSKGSARADTAYRVGDSYTYRELDLYSGAEQARRTETVTAITDNAVIFSDGLRVTDLLGNLLKDFEGRRFTPMQMVPTEYSVGRRWSTRFITLLPNGQSSPTEISFRIVARERVTVPAGPFDAFRIEGVGWSGPVSIRNVRWIAPDRVRVPVAFEIVRQHTAGRVLTASRHELFAYSQHRA